MVRLLLERGATINAFDKKDRRAIHWAAFMGHVEVIRLLVSFGAELSCRDKQVIRLTYLVHIPIQQDSHFSKSIWLWLLYGIACIKALNLHWL